MCSIPQFRNLIKPLHGSLKSNPRWTNHYTNIIKQFFLSISDFKIEYLNETTISLVNIRKQLINYPLKEDEEN